MVSLLYDIVFYHQFTQNASQHAKAIIPSIQSKYLDSTDPRKGKCFHKTNLISTVICEKNPPSKKFKEMDYAVKEGCAT